MKQTAVEWLVNKLTYFNITKEEHYEIFCQIEIEAKKMEKEQQGYSEEEVIELLKKALTHKDDGEIGSLVTAQGEIRPANFFSWFEQFKK